MKKIMIISIIISFFLKIGGVAISASISIDEIIYESNSFNPFLLSGSADFTYENGTLIIKLTNTSGNIGVAGSYNLLTGIGFNLPYGMSIIGGSVEINVGSNAVNFTAPLNPTQWGYDNDPTQGPFKEYPVLGIVNTVVATLQSAIDKDFAGNSVPPGNVDGPGYGLLSQSGNAGGLPAIQDSVLINLTLNGSYPGNLIEYIDERNVVISFGSPTATVPEPSIIILIGSGLIGLAIFGRKRLAKRV